MPTEVQKARHNWSRKNGSRLIAHSIVNHMYTGVKLCLIYPFMVCACVKLSLLKQPYVTKPYRTSVYPDFFSVCLSLCMRACRYSVDDADKVVTVDGDV